MSNPNQSNAMVSYNQPEYPMVLQFRLPKEVFSEDDIRRNDKLQKSGIVIVDVVVNDQPYIGEFWESPNRHAKGHFKEVMDSRPAKGNWDTPTFLGTKPMWYRCLCELEILPK